MPVRSGSGRTVICTSVGQRRVLEMCEFLVHLGKSWAAARKAGQQQTFPVQDVAGQSVAILQVLAAMDALKMNHLSSFCVMLFGLMADFITGNQFSKQFRDEVPTTQWLQTWEDIYACAAVAMDSN